MAQVQSEEQREAGVLANDVKAEPHKQGSGNEDIEMSWGEIVGGWIDFSQRFGKEIIFAFYPSLALFFLLIFTIKAMGYETKQAINSASLMALICFSLVISIRNWRGIIKLLKENTG